MHWKNSISWSSPFSFLSPNVNNVSIGVSEFRQGTFVPMGLRLDVFWSYDKLMSQTDLYGTNSAIELQHSAPAMEYYELFLVNASTNYKVTVALAARVAYEERFHQLESSFTPAGSGIGIR